MTTLADTAPIGESTGTYVGRHWRGEFGLGHAYWVNGVVVSLAAGVLGFLLGAFLNANAARLGPGAINTLALGFYLLAILVTVWQFVGIWRSASLHVSRGGQKGWALAAQVAVVAGTVRNVVELLIG